LTTTLTSIATLDHDEWIVRNVEHPDFETHGSWLEDVVVAHRSTVHDAVGREPEIRFAVGDDRTAARIRSVQDAIDRARALRSEARVIEASVAGDRHDLVDRLTELNVAPSEIASILGLSVRSVRDELGSDEEARIARRILRSLRA
jgi:hypothetical protein